MYTTTMKVKEGKSFVINLGPAPRSGNLFHISDQIGLAAAADKRQVRRRIKAARKSRQWKQE